MSAIFKCNDGNEHDFDSNTESEYCAKGCGEKWAIYAIKKLGADLKEKDAAVEKLKSLFSVQLDVMEQNNNMTTEITALKSKLAKAKSALEYYADDFNWLYNQIKKSDCEEIKFNHVLKKPVPKGLEFEAGGKTARQALKEIGEV